MNLALSLGERRSLFLDHVLRFRPFWVDEPEPRKGSRAGRPSKYGNPNGHLRKVAKQFVAGVYGAKTVDEVARDERVGYESLKASIWKVRDDQKKEAAA